MTLALVHKAPCPQGIFTARPVGWCGGCNCPTGWPKTEEEIDRQATEAVTALATQCPGHDMRLYNGCLGYQETRCCRCGVFQNQLDEIERRKTQ